MTALRAHSRSTKSVSSPLVNGRVLQRLTAIECELHEIRASARIAQRRSPVEVLLGAPTRRPGGVRMIKRTPTPCRIEYPKESHG